MNCVSEQLIALYVEEDLLEPDRRRVESHLRGCVHCAAVVEDLRVSQTIFTKLRHDLPSSNALTDLRQRVLDEISFVEQPSPLRFWLERFILGGLRRKAALATLALFVLGCGAAGALWFARTEAVPVQPVRSIPYVAAVETIADVPPLPPAPAPQKRVRPAPQPLRKAEPVVERLKPQVAIKLLTDDPNVIIYWLVDEEGE